MLQCLLIDGSLTIQKVIKLALSKYDLNVASLNSLHEASVFISNSNTKIDFIISDSFLEGTATPEALKKLSIQAHAPILILNGSFQGVDEASFKKEGFFFFLKKPFESSTLVSSIESLIKKALPLNEDDAGTTPDQVNTSVPPVPPFNPKQARPDINIPPTISFKEELSLQEKMENEELRSNDSFIDKEESTLEAKLPPPPPSINLNRETESFSKDISIKEDIDSTSRGSGPYTTNINIPTGNNSSFKTDVPLPPTPPFIPNIPVDKNKSSKNDSDVASFNLPPPPFVKKNTSTVTSSSEDSRDVFSKKLPPIPTVEDTKDEISTKKDIPFTPSKEYLEQNIEKVVKDYLNSNLQDLVKQEVKNYCDAHFKNIATECIKDKINKLLEEKVSLSEDS